MSARYRTPEYLRTLNHSNPRLCLVCNLGLSTQSHDLRIVHHAGCHPRESVGENLCVRVHAQCELVPIWADTGNPPDRIEEFIIEGIHSLVEHDFLEERHEDDLTVALSSVAGLLLLVPLFRLVPNLLDQDDRDALLFRYLDRVVIVVVESGVYLGLVELLLAVGNSNIGIWFDLICWNNELLHHIQAYARSWQRVSVTDYLTVRDDKNELVAIWIVGGGDRVERRPQACF